MSKSCMRWLCSISWDTMWKINVLSQFSSCCRRISYFIFFNGLYTPKKNLLFSPQILSPGWWSLWAWWLLTLLPSHTVWFYRCILVCGFGIICLLKSGWYQQLKQTGLVRFQFQMQRGGGWLALVFSFIPTCGKCTIKWTGICFGPDRSKAVAKRLKVRIF